MQPNNVAKGSVSICKKFPIFPCLRETIGAQRIQPSYGFDRIQEDDDAIRRGQSNDLVNTLEVGRIWRREIPGRGKRRYSVEGLGVGVACRAAIAEKD